MDRAKITPVPTRDELLARAVALVPVLRERASQTERDRRIPNETIEAIRAAGLWRILQTPRHGGILTDFGIMVDVVAEFARGCASTSWVYMNIIAHNWMLPMWPIQAAQDVWDENPNALIGSSLIFTCGKLRRVKGGYQLTGRWPYCSGIDNSDWMMFGATEPAEDHGGGAEPRMVVVRAADLEIIDTWHVSGGKSYIAQLIAAAGGRYLWSDNESRQSLPLDFEAVYAVAHDADFWFTMRNEWHGRAEVVAADERYGDFAAFKNGQVYNANARLSAQGGNDYWENGIVEPHLILADYIKILHPDILPDHAPVSYTHLTLPTILLV